MGLSSSSQGGVHLGLEEKALVPELLAVVALNRFQDGCLMVDDPLVEERRPFRLL